MRRTSPALPSGRAGARARSASASALAMLLVASLVSGCTLRGGSSDHLVAIFRNAVSLYPDAEVKVLGMAVGTVQSVKVLDDTQVEVAFTVRHDVALPQGVDAVIVPQSLLGARYIQLVPAWVEGEPRLDPAAAGQRVIPVARTSVPAEPDEALAAVNNLLKSLDPRAAGRLVTNLDDDLTGNGQSINDAVRSLAGLSNTLADKDQQLVALVDNLRQFTATLDTRESQLGRVMDLFAQTTSLLARERGTISSLIAGLASASTNALDLVTKHAAPLQADVKSLSDLTQTLAANLANVSVLLSSLPQLVAGPNLDGKAGFIAAYNPTFHRIDLRDSLGSSVNGLLQALGLPLCPAIPLLDVQPQCAPGSVQLSLGLASPATPLASAGRGATAPPARTPAANKGAPTQSASPLAPVLNLLGNGGSTSSTVAGYGVVAPSPPASNHGLLAGAARLAHILLEHLV